VCVWVCVRVCVCVCEGEREKALPSLYIILQLLHGSLHDIHSPDATLSASHPPMPTSRTFDSNASAVGQEGAAAAATAAAISSLPPPHAFTASNPTLHAEQSRHASSSHRFSGAAKSGGSVRVLECVYMCIFL